MSSQEGVRTNQKRSMASISASTSLATFPTSHASSSRLPHITLSPVYGRAEQLAVAAVQADGVWTYDLSTLRPTASFTVPPSTVFATPPISFFPSSAASSSKPRKEKPELQDDSMDVESEPAGVQHERITLVGVERGEKVKPGDEGRNVWVWRGDDGEKQVLEFPHPVHSMHYVSHARFPVLCVSSQGDFTLLDQSVRQHALQMEHTFGDPLMGPLAASAIIGPDKDAYRVVLVDSRGYIRIVRLDLTTDVHIVARAVASGWMGTRGQTQNIEHADINAEGVVTAIDSLGHILSRDTSDLLSIPLSSLPLLKYPQAISTVVSLPSTGQPLALVATAHPSPTLLLATTSPTLPVVLVSGSVSSLTTTGTITHVSILGRPSLSSLLVGTVLTHQSDEGDSGRSVISTCEVALPPKGVGMNMLLGRKTISNEYFSLLSPDIGGGTATANPCEEINSQLGKALQGADTVSLAHGLWTSWLSDNETRLRKSGSDPRLLLPEASASGLLGVVFRTALKPPAKDGDTSASAGRVERSGLYASKIVRDLLNRKVVSDSMWPGGVVAGALVPCHDWPNIVLALRSILTISSSALVAVIKGVILFAQTKSSDPRSKLTGILREILALPTPDPMYRLELRKSLPVEDATIVLDLLTGWAEMHAERRAEGFGDWAAEATNGDTNPTQPITPSLESIITHSSTLLDSHLPLFIGYEPSHDLLLRLQAALEPLIAIQTEFRQLRAPVDAILTLARREQKKREEREAKKVATRVIERPIWGKAPGAKARIRERERKDMEQGKEEVRLPEQMVGKWRVEDFVF